MSVETLSQPVTLAQAAVPIQICYIVPLDSDPRALSAIFEESYSRWGGRDSLIVPIDSNGTIDEIYWAWAKSLDPDVVYSYAELDDETIGRIERHWMPAHVRIHRSSDDLRVRHDPSVEGLSPLSLLPMIAAMRRAGPPRAKALVSAFMEWSRDPFVLDSFGINPQGPGGALYEVVREHIAIMAVGIPNPLRFNEDVDVAVEDTTSLLQLMASNQYETFTMAQLAGMGYDHVHHEHASVWRFFNIIVGDTNLDRIAFWNSRVGSEGLLRSHITAIRVPEERLEDAVFVEALAAFAWRFNDYQSGQPSAMVGSSSVPEARLKPLADALAKRHMLASVSAFPDANACRFDPRARHSMITGRSEQRFTESKAPLVPAAPHHLRNYGPVPPWLTQGSWVVDIGVKRETGKLFGSSVPPMPVPRRLQALRIMTNAENAKVTLGGDFRLVVADAQAPQVLTFVDDDADFIRQLIAPSQAYYTTRTDIRARLLANQPVVYNRLSSAGRHLDGFLNRMGSLQAAADVFESPMWQPILNELSLPRAAFNEESRSDLIAKLKKPFGNNGPPSVREADFPRLADIVARIAPDLKLPPTIRRFDYFLAMFEKTAEAKRIREHAPEKDANRRVRAEAALHVSYRRSESILVQGYAWKCSRCDHPNWKTIKALREVLACEACEQKHAIGADFEWHFMLDGYVIRGIRTHGLRGIIWALGIMKWWGRCSFMFAPQIELFTSESGEEKVVGDLDIACIIDGKLHIGEVKESKGDINDALGEKLTKLAHLIRPDVVVLACPDITASKQVLAQSSRIATKVAHLGINVKALLPPNPAPASSSSA